MTSDLVVHVCGGAGRLNRTLCSIHSTLSPMFPIGLNSLCARLVVVDSENRIYEDIDRNSIGSHHSTTGLNTPENQAIPSSVTAAATDSGFSSGRATRQYQAAGSDDSWGSGEFETFSSDEAVGDDDDDSEKVHSPTYGFDYL